MDVTRRRLILDWIRRARRRPLAPELARAAAAIVTLTAWGLALALNLG